MEISLASVEGDGTEIVQAAANRFRVGRRLSFVSYVMNNRQVLVTPHGDVTLL